MQIYNKNGHQCSAEKPSPSLILAKNRLFSELLVEIKGDKLELKDPSKMATLEYYIDNEKADFITIKRDSSKIIFSFETDGSLSAKDAILESAKILKEKYKELGKQLKSLK